MAHRELLRAWQADPCDPNAYQNEAVLDYILVNGLKMSIADCISDLVNEAKQELADEREQQRLQSIEDARRRDQHYSDIVRYNVKQGFIYVLQHGERITDMDETLYNRDEIVLLGRIIAEKGQRNLWTFYNSAKTVQELPVVHLKPEDIFLVCVSWPKPTTGAV